MSLLIVVSTAQLPNIISTPARAPLLMYVFNDRSHLRLEAKCPECRPNGQIDAFEGCWERFSAAVSGVSVLVMTVKADDTTYWN